jgi:hypothetical protein
MTFAETTVGEAIAARATTLGRGAMATREMTAGRGAGRWNFASTAHPDDRFPQCTHRRNI